MVQQKRRHYMKNHLQIRDEVFKCSEMVEVIEQEDHYDQLLVNLPKMKMVNLILRMVGNGETILFLQAGRPIALGVHQRSRLLETKKGPLLGLVYQIPLELRLYVDQIKQLKKDLTSHTSGPHATKEIEFAYYFDLAPQG